MVDCAAFGDMIHPPRLGGRAEVWMQYPPDHSLGRSLGGFGTKVHLVCDSHDMIVAIHVTTGQRHESKAFEPTTVPAPTEPTALAASSGR